MTYVWKVKYELHEEFFSSEIKARNELIRQGYVVKEGFGNSEDWVHGRDGDIATLSKNNVR